MTEQYGRDFQKRSMYDRDRMEPHFLDWNSQPSVYKEYPGKPVVELPPPHSRAPLTFERSSRAVAACGHLRKRP
jgi:hypothetical protein